MKLNAPLSLLFLALALLLAPIGSPWVEPVLAVNNPIDPDPGDDDDDDCDNNNAETASTGSASLTLPLRTAGPGVDWGSARLILDEITPSSMSYTPYALRFRQEYSVFNYFRVTPTGAPREVSLRDRSGSIAIFIFDDDQSTARVVGSQAARKWLMLMRDAEGAPTTEVPAFYDFYPGNGMRYRYDATKSAGLFGQLVEIERPEGRVYSLEDIGYEIIRGSEGVLRQVRSPSQLSDIVLEGEHGFRVDVYRDEDVIEEKVDGLYTVHSEAVLLEQYIIENPNPGSFTGLRFTRHRGDSTRIYDFTYIPDTRRWVLDVREPTANMEGLPQQQKEHVWDENRNLL